MFQVNGSQDYRYDFGGSARSLKVRRSTSAAHPCGSLILDPLANLGPTVGFRSTAKDEQNFPTPPTSTEWGQPSLPGVRYGVAEFYFADVRDHQEVTSDHHGNCLPHCGSQGLELSFDELIHNQ